jgi:hypothetical protein
MNMNRRHVIRVALVGTVTLVAGGPVDVLAAQGGALIPAQLGPLDLFFDFNWDVALESAAVAFVKSLFGQFTASVGRRFGVNTETRGTSSEGHAIVNASIHKNPSGSLLVHGHMLDGNGRLAMTHDGTAPSHTHPAMRDHVGAIVNGAHTWLHARGR